MYHICVSQLFQGPVSSLRSQTEQTASKYFSGPRRAELNVAEQWAFAGCWGCFSAGIQATHRHPWSFARIPLEEELGGKLMSPHSGDTKIT